MMTPGLVLMIPRTFATLTMGIITETTTEFISTVGKRTKNANDCTF